MRKRYNTIILLLLITTVSFAQEMNDEGKQILSYIQNVMSFNKAIPQEKVYMHFDNTGYFENETMWFKAYVTRSTTYSPHEEKPLIKPTNLSKVLYVELLNPSGDVLKTTKWPIDSLGQAYGDMKLDTLFGSGFYEVRAYTRYMTNWGVNACFSRVFPVFSEPAEEGDYHDLSIKTRLQKERDPNNRDQSDSLYTKAIEEGIYTNSLAKTVSVQFYPEGGDLIKGKKCNVAMLAVDDNGRPYEGTGFVQNENGDVLANVNTDSLGRGLFTIIPDGTKLTFQIKNLKNTTQYFNLPKTKNEGCALSIDAINEDILVSIQCTDSICGNLIGYAILNNGNITYCDTVVAQSLVEVELDRLLQRDGVNQFTVFDSKGRILAERLYFIYPKQTADNSIVLTPETKRLKPCGDVVIKAKTMPNTTFSFSVIDPKNMTNGKQGNIFTWMLLSSDVKGYINNVEYYFESDDKTHRKAADLLMLTQGWRRYDWELMDGLKSFDNVQPIEDKFYIYGKLKEYRKRNKARGVDMDIFLYHPSGQSLHGETTTDSIGNYAFSLPFMDDDWKVEIQTRIDDKKKTFYVGIDRNFSPVPRFISPLEAKITPPLMANYLKKGSKVEDIEEEIFIPITERNHLLENVTVKARRQFFTNDDWTYKDESFGRQNATLFYDIEKELDKILDSGEPEPTLCEWLAKKNMLFDYDVKNPYNSARYGGDFIDFILDNNERNITDELYNLNREIGTNDYWMHDVKKLYIAPHSRANVMQELINTDEKVTARFYLYMNIKQSTESKKGIRHTIFHGFNKPSTFKTEDYSVLPPMADFRRTIFWEPNVKTDNQGNAEIRFYNNSTCDEMFISAEGISNNGQIIYK